MTTISEYNLFLDSKYRTGGSNPAPEFALKSPIILSNPNHRFVAQIKSVDIPYSFKSLVAPFNTIRIRYLEVGHTDQTTTLTIPEGNYSISVLLSTLETLLDTFISPIAQHPPAYDFSYDRNTGKCTLLLKQVNGNNATSVTLYWADPNVDFLAEFFGFTGDFNTIIGYTGPGVPANTNNVSEINVNCSPVSSIYVRSTTLTQPSNNDEYLVEFDQSVSDILLKVPVTTPYGTWLIYYNSDVEVTLNNKLIDVVQMYITHLTYNPISLQGVHWRSHLYIREVRDPYLDEIDKLAKEQEAKIRELEEVKQGLMEELGGISSQLKQSFSAEQPTTEEKNIETEKQEFLREIEQNKNNVAT